MKIKFFLLISILLVAHYTPIYAQDPITEDIMDIFDDDDEEPGESNSNENNGSTKGPTKEDILGLLNNVNELGALGSVVDVESVRLTMDGECSKTFVCMSKVVDKYTRIANYEQKLNDGKGTLLCEEEVAILNDYSLYLLAMNLDIYCIDSLHPDNHQLSDDEFIDVLLAISRFNRNDDIGTPNPYPNWPVEFWDVIFNLDPFCSNNLQLLAKWENLICNCENFSGTIDEAQRETVINFIRLMIDEINPLWQLEKAKEISARLKALPCNK